MCIAIITNKSVKNAYLRYIRRNNLFHSGSRAYFFKYLLFTEESIM